MTRQRPARLRVGRAVCGGAAFVAVRPVALLVPGAGVDGRGSTGDGDGVGTYSQMWGPWHLLRRAPLVSAGDWGTDSC